MFKKTKLFLLLLFFMNLESDQELIKSKIASILPPDVTIEKIEQSSIDGLFKVFYGDIQPIYVTANGSHFIYGDMFQINKDGITNITEIDINKKRAQVLSQIPKRELISFVSDRPGHDKRYAIDSSKITSELGWMPNETFDTGLLKTVKWYLSNSDWWERVLNGKYRLDRIGEIK